MANVTRITGDLGLAEDSVQEACLAAVQEWDGGRLPRNPQAWLTGVARHKAIDRMRRESLRRAKEDAAATSTVSGGAGARVDDDLWLICLCCHPALSAPARIALTLRAVCGLTTAEIAAAFLVTEATMAKRLARAKTKVRESGMALGDPRAELPRERTTDVLKVIYLIFSEGHRATSGAELVRADLCLAATNLARALAALTPGDPEVLGLLALLLLTDARRPARADADGTPVLLEEQDRSLWSAEMVEEGEQILIAALKLGQPGPYQLWAAIAACHSTARRAAATDWRQISVLYSELLRFDPSPVIEANRAIAVAMAEGPAAGLTILDIVAADARLKTWPAIHLARADLLRRLGRVEDAKRAYLTALELEPPEAERRFIASRLGGL